MPTLELSSTTTSYPGDSNPGVSNPGDSNLDSGNLVNPFMRVTI